MAASISSEASRQRANSASGISIKNGAGVLFRLASTSAHTRSSDGRKLRPE